ncbi:hypothetical protein OIU79_008155 [Salix purpurea]|uniref:Uncharacterized protein n=1 Tax=Salix purpurea TaxID=77065 RepID=A0A9Q0THR1_SALPP|nr:hypothetical protein OIU79_008155 [Salix purpurea]
MELIIFGVLGLAGFAWGMRCSLCGCKTHGRGVQHGGSQVNQASSNAEFNMDPRSIQQLQPDLENAPNST